MRWVNAVINWWYSYVKLVNSLVVGSNFTRA